MRGFFLVGLTLFSTLDVATASELAWQVEVSDVVQKVSSPLKGTGLEVRFQKLAAVYVLPLSHANFTKMKSRLEKSQNSQLPLALKLRIDKALILDAKDPAKK